MIARVMKNHSDKVIISSQSHEEEVVIKLQDEANLIRF